MDEQSRILLAIGARLLSYPADDIAEEYRIISETINQEIDSAALTQRLTAAIEPIYQLTLNQHRQLYVETFDLKEKAGLYLTAHELGDSRKRGMELVGLQTMIQKAGFLFRADELADYMPMLYELLAVTENSDDEDIVHLYSRLSVATERIRRHLDEDHLYKPFFDMLMDLVFELPTAEQLKKMEQAREKPDLDPMPFPLMYK